MIDVVGVGQPHPARSDSSPPWFGPWTSGLFSWSPHWLRARSVAWGSVNQVHLRAIRRPARRVFA